jgi:nitroreductase
MEYLQLIKERYSVRKFGPQPVEEGKLAVILDAARVAPTAANKQSQRVLVIRDAAGMEKLKGCTTYTFNAPMALAVCCRRDEAWVRPYDGDNAGVVDASIIGTQIMLAVHDLGLGSTWVGYFDPAAFRAAFHLPEGVEPVALFPIGYPAADAKPSHMHESRRPLTETVVYDSF